jgi:hypothetical protein
MIAVIFEARPHLIGSLVPPNLGNRFVFGTFLRQLRLKRAPFRLDHVLFE